MPCVQKLRKGYKTPSPYFCTFCSFEKPIALFKGGLILISDFKEEAISALVEELCGGAVSAALDFLEKELRRLKEERRQHAFILIAR